MDSDMDEPQLQIIVNGKECLRAPEYALRCMSTCACALPAEAGVWDLSGLLIDGKPVPEHVVKAWHGAVYKQLGHKQHSKELSSASKTMDGLYQLLRFADAVGSRQGVLQACLAHVGALEIQLPCGSKELVLVAGEDAVTSLWLAAGTFLRVHMADLQAHQESPNTGTRNRVHSCICCQRHTTCMLLCRPMRYNKA
jgi:hypothetical protein